MIGIGIQYGPAVDISIRIYDVIGSGEYTLIDEMYPLELSSFSEDASSLARKYGIEFTKEMESDFFSTMRNDIQRCASFRQGFEWQSWMR